MKNMIGIIGGSGFYDFVDNAEIKKIETPFGDVNYEIGYINGKEICFIPRHGSKHSVAPSQINYRANIYASYKLEVEYIIATNAVGSTHLGFSPGMFAVPDNILDFTHGRDYTYFDDFSINIDNKEPTGVVHTDVSEIFHYEIRNRLLSAANKLNLQIYDGGTLVVSNGPRFETPAEIKAYRILGGDFVGMTSSPEIFLAKELKIPYATMVIITNYGAGLQKSVSAEEVFDLFAKKISLVKEIIRKALV